jgi:hypothetical protein
VRLWSTTDSRSRRNAAASRWGPAAANRAISRFGTKRRRPSANGRSSATGSPLRVMMKVSPAATVSIIRAFWFRRSRCGIVRLTSLSVARLATARYNRGSVSLPALSAEDVYAGLLRTTDLAEPRVAGAVLGLFATLAVMVLWQCAPCARARRWCGWSIAIVVFSALDLLARQVQLAGHEQGAFAASARRARRRRIAAPAHCSVCARPSDGPLPTYRDVQYAPRNPLLEAGSGGDLI